MYHQPSAGVYRCDRCLKEYVRKKFLRNISQHGLIESGERIAAAVSGGTDSITNLYLLADFAEYRDVEVISLTIDEGIEGYRDESLPMARGASEDLGLEHEVISFKGVLGRSLDEMAEISEERDGPDPCTLCGILRRTLLNQGARELGTDKLAVAHNLDDEVQTIMLNYLRGDLQRLYRLGPRSRGREGFVPRIKPLREITEKEAAIYAMLEGLDVHMDTCPYVGGMRSEVREFLNRMERNHPTTKYRILRMFEEIRPHLPVDPGDVELGECEICGEPSTGDLCRACELLNEIGLKRKKSLIFE